MTPAQRDVVRRILERLAPEVVIHGDCVGADDDFDQIAQELGIPRYLRPCDIASARAHCDRREGTRVVSKVKRPLVRNKDIVYDGKALLACPTGPEVKFSGTWATIRYAKRAGKTVIIVWPNGQVSREDPKVCW